MMTYIAEPDASEHQFLFADPRQLANQKDPDAAGAKVERYASYLQHAYRQADNAVQRIIAAVGTDAHGRPNSNIIVVSDHGMDPYYKAVNAGVFLEKNGFDTAKQVRAVTVGPVANFYINLQGREPDGVVSRSEYLDIQQKLKAALENLTDNDPNNLPNTDNKVFDKIYLRPVNTDTNDPAFGLGGSEFLGQDAGDILALLRVGYNFETAKSPRVTSIGDTSFFSGPKDYGAHGYDPGNKDMSAIFYAAGPEIRPGNLARIRTIDIAPFILKLSNVKPAATVQGDAKVLDAAVMPKIDQSLAIRLHLPAKFKGVAIYDGYGSAVAAIPDKPDEFWLLSGHGPNIKAACPGQNPRQDACKLFPRPDLAPKIGHFVRNKNILEFDKEIVLKDQDGKPLTGIPNPKAKVGTEEMALGRDGQRSDENPSSIDPAGLVALEDGTFWVSDAYGSNLIHFDTDGNTLETLTPFGPNQQNRQLPQVLAKRQPNQGMEGLTVTPDGMRLVGIMQAPLNNENTESAKNTAAVRILTYDLVDDATHTMGKTHQYIYLLDSPDNVASEIAALSGSDFLVNERDDKLPGDESKPTRKNCLYRISLAGAADKFSLSGPTDISDPEDHDKGLSVIRNEKPLSIEALVKGKSAVNAQVILSTNGINPVSKTLSLDLLTDLGDPSRLFPHDKAEGLAVIDGGRRLVITNNNGFGISSDSTESENSRFVNKCLPIRYGKPANTLDCGTKLPRKAVVFTQMLIVDLQNVPNAERKGHHHLKRMKIEP